MRAFRDMVLFVGMALFMASFASFAHAGESRHALVIGNSAYAHTDRLANPAKDARLIADALRHAGFRVDLQVDLSQKQMKRTLRDFSRSVKASGSGAVGLVYFAGHGTQVGGRNFLIPVDANIATESDVAIEAVGVDDVLSQIEGAGASLTIIILDACRNNPYERGSRASVRGFAPVHAAKGSLIAYSTAPGTQSLDGEGDNSPYARALNKFMRTPGLSVEKMFKNIRVEVDRETAGHQTPWEESSLFGDFVFLNKTDAKPSVAGTPRTGSGSKSETRLAAETAFWNTVRDSDNPAAVQSYLSTFPSGLFAPIARLRIKSLQRRQQAAIERQQVRDNSRKTVAASRKDLPLPHSRTQDCLRFNRSDGTDLYCVSSVLKQQKDNFYGVASLLDDSNYTAWFEGKRGDGVGEWLTVDFGETRRVDKLRIKNGYNKREDLYFKNGRLRALNLVFSDGESRTLAIKDEPGWQEIDIPRPPLARWVQLKIAMVARGEKYRDTGINELRVVSNPAQP